MKLLAPTLLALLGSSSLLPAAITFTEDFSDNSPNPNMTIGSGFGSPTTTTTGNFTITSGDGSRIYLGTNTADYSTVDFVFQATVTIATGSAWSSPFIGMGNSAAGASAFGEPVTGSSEMYMLVRPDVGSGSLFSGYNLASNATAATNQGAVAGALAGPVMLRMTWNATTKSALFEYDAGNNGSIEKSFTLTDSANSFTAANSQLFIGGGSGLVIDDISVTVVPEPSAALLGGLGLLGLLRRRRC